MRPLPPASLIHPRLSGVTLSDPKGTCGLLLTRVTLLHSGLPGGLQRKPIMWEEGAGHSLPSCAFPTMPLVVHAAQIGDTALAQAAWKGHLEAARLLLKGGANPMARNNVRSP